jgi:hypothetical protein
MKDFRVIAAASFALVAVTSASAFAQEAVTNTQTATEIVGEVGGPEIAGGPASGVTFDPVDPNTIKPFADPTDPRNPLNAECAVVRENELHEETVIASSCTSDIPAIIN